MDFNKMTESVRNALQSASSLAREMSHQAIDCEHLLLALLKQDESLAVRILQKMELNKPIFVSMLVRLPLCKRSAPMFGAAPLFEVPRIDVDGKDPPRHSTTVRTLLCDWLV